MKSIVLAGGCFWGLEAYLKKYEGIISTEVGYANGIIENPTYEQVKTSGTGHAEVVKVTYNPAVISLAEVLMRFWIVVDPTVENRQGPDIGHQYRTGIYYTDKGDLEVIEQSLEEEQKKYERKIVTEVEPLGLYYIAEDYHQNYLEKNPNGYCHIDLSLY